MTINTTDFHRLNAQPDGHFLIALNRLFGIFILTALLAGCGGMQAFQEGNTLLAEGRYEQGLAKLEESVRLEPKNAEFRIALATRRSTVINRLITAGEAALQGGQISEAEKIYRQVLGIDASNAMAHQGLEALVMERRHRQVISECETLFRKGEKADWPDLLEKLRPVLAENPRQKDVLNLKARIDDVRFKELRPEIKLAATFRKPISLEFRDAPLKSVLEVIAKVSGLNFFYDKDVRPDLKATVFAKNTTIEDAMRLVLVTNQLDQKILNENTILIYPVTPQKIKDYQTLSVRTFYLNNADVKAVSNSIKTIVKTKDMVIDERLGIIIIRDTPDAIRMAERIVALQDLSDPEVMLEVEVMEVKRSRLMELGIQWPSQLTLSPLPTGGTSVTWENLKRLNSTTTQATLGNVVMNARKEDQDSNILANPRIRVRNKEKAKIQIGDRVPVITTTSTSTGFISESVSYVDVGLKLEVEPHIYLDEEVAIKINLEVSNLVREIISKSGTLSYQIGTRGANTVLRLKDGETQILAGLISDQDRSTANKVPGLGELPVAGRLFGSQMDNGERSEILLSITPHVVRSIRRPDLLSAEFESGTETSIGSATLHMSTVDTEKPDASAAKAAGTPAAGQSSAPASASPAKPSTSDVPPTSVVPTPVPVPTSPTSSGPSPTPTAAVATVTTPSLSWQAPSQVKVGEQFSAVLQISSQGALRGLPLMVGFDPQLLQVANVQEGEFFKQGNTATNFSQRIDPAQGKVFAAVVRQSSAGVDGGVNGSGSVVTLTFKALKASTPSTPNATPSSAKVQLLSASPDPAPTMPVVVPLEYLVRIVP